MINNARFEKLLEPYHIGQVKTRNRMIKTAAETCFYDGSDGYISETCKAFYEKLAVGGVGALYVEGPAVDGEISSPNPGGFRIDDDKFIPALSELTKVIHKHGCPTFVQLLHAGPWHRSWLMSGLQPVAASSLPEAEIPGYAAPRGLTVNEIEDLVDKFASAAVRAQKAGFDGVDINSGGSHLLNTFLSPFFNKREDDYGYASLENRSRFMVNIVKEIKSRLGQDFPVGVLFNGAEYGGNGEGITIKDAQGLARIFEGAGADSIQLRSHRYGTILALWPEHLFYPKPMENLPKELDWSNRGAGAYAPIAAAVKKAVSIPVITVGRLDPVLGEKILRQGQADFIGFTRRLLADPDLPNKVASGRLEEIAPCTACFSCLDRIKLSEPVRCRINASLGREREYAIKKAETKKRVLVIGGGPAGMEAARVAALRGHEVILYAREHKLGGLLHTAALVKGQEIEDLEGLIRYFKIQLDRLGAKVRLGKEVDPSVIEDVNPQVLIVASGGIPTLPEIPGINGPNVVSGPDLYRRVKIYQRFFRPRTLRWLTKFWMPLGKRVVIIGGGIQGCELAEFLVKRGRKVCIVDTAEELGDEMGDVNKGCLFKWLAEEDVTMMTEVAFEEITEKGLIITTKEGTRKTLEADTIVTAMPMRPNTEILESLDKKDLEIYPIGDCSEPHLIIDAIADGSRVGHSL